jgi:hypothetical protein
VTPATPSDPAALARLEWLAHLLDSRWRIPGTGVRFGLDGVASLFPLVGDSATALVSLYLLAEARRQGARRGLLVRMAGNVALDWAVGSIPILGTLFDIGFKANKRNLALLRRHLKQPPAFHRP